MNLALKLLNIYMPPYVKRSGIKQLFNASAEAFDSAMPDIQALSTDACLRQFALFTKNQVDKLINKGNNLEAVKKRLYEKAFQLGEKYRKKFRVQDLNDVMETAQIFYRIIGIKFKGNSKGEVIINRCYFSKIYNDQTCQVMSAMDSGLLAGLANGGELIFCTKITENYSCCQADFVLPEKVI